MSEKWMKLVIKDGVLNLEHEGKMLPGVTDIDVSQDVECSRDKVCKVVIECWAVIPTSG